MHDLISPFFLFYSLTIIKRYEYVNILCSIKLWANIPELNLAYG